VTVHIPDAELPARIRAYKGPRPTGGHLYDPADPNAFVEHRFKIGISSIDPGFAPLIVRTVVFPDWPVPHDVWERAVVSPCNALNALVQHTLRPLAPRRAR
jgi:hypothetical protein